MKALADQTFGFFIPTVSLMGVGSSKETGAQVKTLGAKKSLSYAMQADKMGVADKIKEQIEAAGVQALIYPGAEPNPTDKNVHDGLKVYQDNKCDGIVSIPQAPSHRPRLPRPEPAGRQTDWRHGIADRTPGRPAGH